MESLPLVLTKDGIEPLGGVLRLTNQQSALEEKYSSGIQVHADAVPSRRGFTERGANSIKLR